MKIVPKDSRYVPIPQQKQCCVPACFSILMNKNGIPLIPQELIGYEFGLVVPDEDADKFWNPRTGKPHPSGYGTNVGEGDRNIDINKALKKLNIPLKVSFKYIDQFKNFDNFLEYIEELIGSDEDAIACFDWGTLSGNRDHKWGHVSIIDIFDKEQNIVRLVDPGYNGPMWRKVAPEVLYDAMKVHTKEKGAGFWEVEKI